MCGRTNPTTRNFAMELQQRCGVRDREAENHLRCLPEDCSAMGLSEVLAVLDSRITYTDTFPSSVLDSKGRWGREGFP